MKCDTIAGILPDIIAGGLSPSEIADCRQHINECGDCAHALRGTAALQQLRDRRASRAPTGLLGRITAELEAREPGSGRKGFWLGTAFGGALAASLVAAALTLGWIGPPENPVGSPAAAEFTVALGESRSMDVAIETLQALEGAEISIMLSGGVELDGYGGRRELSWTTNLEAGVNRLSLPIIAVTPDGGRMIVRLSHPQSEQIFVIDLRTSA